MTRHDPLPPVRARVGGYVELAPPPAAAGFVECAWVHAVGEPPAADADPAWHRVLPDDAPSVAFTCRRDADGRALEPRLALVGPVRTPRLFPIEPGRELVAVKLRPEWVPALLDTVAADHADAFRAVDALAPRALGGADERLAATRGWREALAVVWDIVLARARRAGRRLDAPDAAQRAVALLRRAPPRAPVAWTAARLGVSPRHLRRLVHDAVRVPPKELAAGWRFLRALAAADATVADGAARPGWAAIAAHVGYADQAHLGRDFRALTGVTPEQLLGERRRESAAYPPPR